MRREPRITGRSGRRRWSGGLTLLASAGNLVLGCHGADELPAPHRVPLGVFVNARGAPSADPLLVEAYSDLAQGAFPFASLQVDWGEVEERLGNYDWTGFDNHLRQAEQRDVPLAVALALVENEVRGSLPTDLRGQWWESVNLRVRCARFCALLIERGRGRVAYLWLGRESDVYLSQHPSEREDFRTLLLACQDSLRLRHPQVGVGTVFAFAAARAGGWPPELRSILEAGDRIGLTVYGRDGDFRQTLGPGETLALLGEAVAEFPGRRLVLTEIGFPHTGDGAEQLAFSRGVTAWLDDAPENLESVSWSLLYDAHFTESIPQSQRLFPEDSARASAYREQLESLGLRLVSGSITPTWLHVAGWNAQRSVALP